MAENFSIERRKLMRFLGAKVVLTPAALRGTGMLAKAAELADAHGRFLCRQFDNEANADMTDSELEISRSMPSARFDTTPTPTATAAAPAPAPASDQADVEDFVTQVVADANQPVVLFALEWCEFCWSLRKLFAQASIPFRSIDLDSTAYQAGDRGGQIRAVLRQRIGSPTIPQVFIGEHIGGCTDTLDAFKSGQLQALLAKSGVAFDPDTCIDPHSLLPGWLQAR